MATDVFKSLIAKVKCCRNKSQFFFFQKGKNGRKFIGRVAEGQKPLCKEENRRFLIVCKIYENNIANEEATCRISLTDAVPMLESISEFVTSSCHFTRGYLHVYQVTYQKFNNLHLDIFAWKP